MSSPPRPEICAAEVVLSCRELDRCAAFFTEQLGFRLDSVIPADAPRRMTVSGHGVRLSLERGPDRPGSPLRLRSVQGHRRPADTSQPLTAPNGTRILWVHDSTPDALPPTPEPGALIHTSSNQQDSAWGQGRAGMLYRDLIPSRLGGRLIASHIKIEAGGPVPDYVHFHRIYFQSIYCRRGWVRVVYEDQGEPFVLEAGDCVLQPPGIRHRVLESSPGLEVIELSSPAEHETLTEHDLELPNPTHQPDRKFGLGQRFVRHHAAAASWCSWRSPAFEYRDSGIAKATDDRASLRVVRPARDRGTAGNGVASPNEPWSHDARTLFWFVLSGQAELRSAAGSRPLDADDALVLPPGESFTLADSSSEFELLEISLR